MIKPAVLLAPPVELDWFKSFDVDTYPELDTLPDPICTKSFEVPFVDTSLKMTVRRFAEAGRPTKSILVPDVEATEIAVSN